MDESTRKGMASSKSEHWGSPENLIVLVEALGGGSIALDPAANPSRLLANTNLYPPDHDGLKESWRVLADGGLTYCNPPYGRATKNWVQKAVIESARGTEIVLLTAARTDTAWFHKWILPTAQACCLVEGRLKFIDLQNPELLEGDPAFFPSLVSYWGPQYASFEKLFSQIGHVFIP